MTEASSPPSTSIPPDSIANHRFSGGEIEELRRYGTVSFYDAGTVLYEEGTREVGVHVVLSGELEIFIQEKGAPRRVGWLEPGQFSGDVSSITGQTSLARAVMLKAGEVLSIDHDAFHRLLVENSALSDVFVNALVARRAWARASGRGSVVLVGLAYDRDSFAIRDLLTKHAVPHLWVDADQDEAAEVVLEKQGLTRDQVPALITGTNNRLIRPSLEEVSAHLGLDLVPDGTQVDVAVVGAGPAGLAAAVYAASEGLSVVALDSAAPGGQAGTSSKIENYLGFPTGISGRDLAERAAIQAQKFGARLAAPASAAAIHRDGQLYQVALKDGRSLKARAVVLACGAQYRRLPIPELEHYEGSGIYYGATAMEAQLCMSAKVAIVGAGNSAGQGAVFLAKTAEEVHVLFRRDDLRETMSEYLVRRLEETPNIILHPATEIASFAGNRQRLQAIHLKRHGKETDENLPTPFVFLFIGATPCTDWLPEDLARDEKDFLKTGPDIAPMELVRAGWSLERMPRLYETNWPRVYAVGDVRSGSVKRVASGVGEGSVVVQYVHRALQEIEPEGA